MLGIGPERLAELAVKALLPKAPPMVSIDHIHMVRVSVREHAELLREKLVRLRTATFRTLCADCQSRLEVVARFLALLELYREGLVAFDQSVALGDLIVQWTGDENVFNIQVDEYAGSPAPAEIDVVTPIGEAELVEALANAGGRSGRGSVDVGAVGAGALGDRALGERALGDGPYDDEETDQ